MIYVPAEQDIERVQRELRFDRMQAIYHLRGKQRLAELAELDRRRKLAESLRALSTPHEESSCR